MGSLLRLALSFLFGLSLIGCSAQRQGAALFPEPSAAMTALEEAVATRSTEKAQALFGPEGDYLLHTGDPALDTQRGERFVELFNQRHALERRDDNSYVVVLGKKNWPFPVPLLNDGDGWYFDAESGREEILARTIGRNELTTLSVARSVALAQRLYAAHNPHGDGVPGYASRLISTPGNRDGLYWPTVDGEPESPLGPLAARAADENYVITPGGAPQPYHGYYHKIFLTAPSSADAADPLSKPGRYWLLSYPAAWGVSGIMTFATNERGWIYEKNLGPEHDFPKVQSVAIDSSWTRIE